MFLEKLFDILKSLSMKIKIFSLFGLSAYSSNDFWLFLEILWKFRTAKILLEENNEIGNASYLLNETSLALNSYSKILFRERKNKKTDLREFYNLMYQYENDCLVASIEYNKDYYSDRELKPTEELFFSISIVPFANVGSPKISK